MAKQNNKFTKIIIRNLVVIVVMMIIGALFAGMYAKHKQSTSYTSESNVIIGHNLTRNNHRNTNVLADINMMPSYKEMASDSQVLEATRNLLSKKMRSEYSVNELSGVISFRSRPDSLVLNISATTSSKNKSVAIVNAAAKAVKNEFPKMDPGVGSIRILGKAREKNTESTTRPSIKKYVVLGTALGLLLGMIISFSITSWKHFI
ncbi:capsular biosynthesis protein [Limosilactobacillus antri]|uniref:capsular biosynthesis protein n=1 Tax=Limosilactobacillus antri TaxID=227943 RepID=UPI001F572FFC|nr:capsular biosynthesis protein [Limosilactobacillus antri]